MGKATNCGCTLADLYLSNANYSSHPYFQRWILVHICCVCFLVHKSGLQASCNYFKHEQGLFLASQFFLEQDRFMLSLAQFSNGRRLKTKNNIKRSNAYLISQVWTRMISALSHPIFSLKIGNFIVIKAILSILSSCIA